MNATHGSAGYANASHTLLNGRHAKIYADEPADAEAWIDILRHTPDPSLTWQIVPAYRQDTHFGMELIPPPNRPAAILCSDNACSAPLTSPQAFREALGAI